VSDVCRHVQCVRELCSHEKIQVNITDSSHRTPIHFAAVEGGVQQRRCIVVLWKRGFVHIVIVLCNMNSADLTTRARSGTTAYEIARECKQFACAELLRRLAKKTDRESVDTDDEVRSDAEGDDNDEQDPPGPAPHGGAGTGGGSGHNNGSDASDSEGDSASDSGDDAGEHHQSHSHPKETEESPDGNNQVTDNNASQSQENGNSQLTVTAPGNGEVSPDGSQSPKKKGKLPESEQRRIQDDLCEQLFAAAKTNRYSEVMALLQPNPRASKPIFVCSAISPTHGSSPVHAAAARGALNALRYFIISDSI